MGKIDSQNDFENSKNAIKQTISLMFWKQMFHI